MSSEQLPFGAGGVKLYHVIFGVVSRFIEQARLAPTEPPLLVHAKMSSICLAEALSK